MSKAMGEQNQRSILHLEEAVNALYRFRDCYFRSHSGQDPQNKWPDVEMELQKVLREFECYRKMEQGERAKYFFLLGRALNVTESYKPEAEEVLTKAIKLDMKLYQAWNELGETYCKKKDLSEAKNCFLGALEQQNNKESLRNLSILMRTAEFWNLANGMKYAKEAVELDPKDGKSWLVLGNAYTSLYGAKQDPKILNLSKSAYSLAEKDENIKTDPFLYYNKGIVEKFQDDYESALMSFQKAEKLDPTWLEPQLEKTRLLEFLEKAQKYGKERGRLKGKKLKKLLRTINTGLHLGRNRTRKHVYLKDLKNGENKGTVVLGIVAATFPEESRFNLSLVDARENSVVINIYNLPQERGILIGSVLAVPDPLLSPVQVSINGRHYAFDSIRVETPSALIVNGKAINVATRNVCFTTTTTCN